MIYSNYERNHVVIPGREKKLEAFLKQDYKGMQHKWENGFNSHSEDALTWSCFDLISNFSLSKKISVLDEIFEDSFAGKSTLNFRDIIKDEIDISIHIGKQYTGFTTNETTEVDASIELPNKLIFFEAKLYSTVSMSEPPEKLYDQIAQKLRIGLDNPLQEKRDFYFIFIDIAPLDKLNCRRSIKEALLPSKGFSDKWKSAWLFKYYKYGRNKSHKPIQQILNGIKNIPSIETITSNMGWLTWTDLFKDILRGMVKE